MLHVATFYHFVAIDDPAELRAKLEQLCADLGVTGTILVAPEGINATVTATPEALALLMAELRADARFAGLRVKSSLAHAPPFGRLKVKLKPEIVTFKAPEAAPARRTGTRVAPRDWDAWIAAPDVVLIDTRNAYEVAVGTFRGAVDPGTASFTEFKAFADANLDPARDRRIAMFCTGGIRCEKASAYLLARGFAEVAQLDGGILQYLEDVPDGAAWTGECYVFDDRVALKPGLKPGTHGMCTACGMPVAASTACSCGRAA